MECPQTPAFPFVSLSSVAGTTSKAELSWDWSYGLGLPAHNPTSSMLNLLVRAEEHTPLNTFSASHFSTRGLWPELLSALAFTAQVDFWNFPLVQDVAVYLWLLYLPWVEETPYWKCEDLLLLVSITKVALRGTLKIVRKHQNVGSQQSLWTLCKRREARPTAS